MWCSSPDHYTIPLCSNKNKQTKTNKSCALLSEVRKKNPQHFYFFKKIKNKKNKQFQ